MAFCRLSDGKVSHFSEDLEFREGVVSIQNLVPCLVCLIFFYGGRKEDPSFTDSRRFLPIMIGEGGSYFGKDDLFFLLRNCLPDRTAARSAFLSEEADLWKKLHLYHDELVGSFVWWGSRSGEEHTWIKRLCGVADRGRKHLDKKGIRDMRYPGIRAEGCPSVPRPTVFWT